MSYSSCHNATSRAACHIVHVPDAACRVACRMVCFSDGISRAICPGVHVLDATSRVMGYSADASNAASESQHVRLCLLVIIH